MITPPARPPTVEIEKAIRPSTMMNRVWICRKLSPTMVAPTEVARKMVTMFIRAF